MRPRFLRRLRAFAYASSDVELGMRTQVLKLFWVATLVFAAGLGYLWARVTVTSVSRALWVAEPPPTAVGAAPATKRIPDALSDYRIIEERNLFNARPEPAAPMVAVVVPPPPPIQPPVAPPPPPPPPEPPLDLKLVGTAVMGAGSSSYAIVVTGSDTRVVREKEDIIPGATLVEVRNDKILVRWRDKVEEFQLYETKTLAPAPAAPRTRSRPIPQAPGGTEGTTAPSPTAPPPTADSVRKLADDRWSVDNKEVAQLRENMSSVMTQVRVVPNFGEGGQPDGFKVFAIRPGSLFAKIGLQNGDVIRRINGIEMQGPEQAMEAYARLREETTINIDLLRQNQSRTLTYEIH